MGTDAETASDGPNGTSQKAWGKSGQELPSRYACAVCGLCIATSEHLAEGASAPDDTWAFSRLYFPDEADKGQGGMTVSCPCCESGLGTRGDGAFLLRRERVVKRIEKLEIMVCSLKQQEIDSVTPVLKEVFPHCNVNTRVLQKSELRGFSMGPGGGGGASPPKSPGGIPDLVVVVHRNEGRALLTDRNGFYHDVLGSAWQLTRGNVLVVLTRTEPKADAELYDTQLLRNLSTQGDQPTIGAIAALNRVLTWGTSPSGQQLNQLWTLTSKAYFREVPDSALSGIPAGWCKAPMKSPGGANWCNLL